MKRLRQRRATGLPAMLLALVLLLLALDAFARSVPLVVERLDREIADSAAAEVIAGAHDADFVAQPYAAITPSRQHAVWYRVHLASDWSEPRPAVLGIFDPHGLSVRVYVPPDRDGVTYDIYAAHQDAGFTRHALMIFLPETLRAAQPVYLHVAPERAVPRRIEIRGVVDARIDDLARARLDVLFPAVQLATVLVMFCFFVVLRERMYIYFVVHVCLIVLYELYAFGIGYELAPFDLLTPLGARASWLMASFAAVLLIDFSRQFLELPRCAPRLDRVLAALRWPLALLVLLEALPPLTPGWWVEDALAVMFLVVAPLLLIAGVVAWQQGWRRGGYYLCAWVPGLLFIIVRTLQLMLHWPLPDWLEFVLPAAFAFASLVLSFGLADHTLAIRHERDVAHRLAEHDVLTGVLNRRAILACLRAAFLDARESGSPLAVLFLDLDHFKRVNDSYGHRAGDQCLRAVIAPIANELRQGDALGRYGGEEFLVVLPGAAMINARVVAERIRRRVEKMPMLVSGVRIGLTLSIGIAVFEDGVATPEDLIERADAALYCSKASGRNLVSVHASGISSAQIPGADV